MFHRIYESMGLGMHPANLYPRRSRIAPNRAATQARVSSRNRTFILRVHEMAVKYLYRLELLGWGGLTPRTGDRII